MGVNMSWQLAGTWDRATIHSIRDNNKLFCPAEEKLSENCPVELVESRGTPGEVWHLERIIDGPEKPNVFNAHVACEADLNFVLAEKDGMLVLQEKRNDKNGVFQIWEILGEGPGSKNVIDDSTFEVSLPYVTVIPEGFENPSMTTVGTDGTSDAIWTWKVPKDKIGIIYKNIFYTAIVDTSISTVLTATVKDGVIVRVSGAELMPSMTLKDWLNLDEHWTKDALLQVSTLSSRGIISQVEKMYLSSHLLVPDDVGTAAPAISVVNTLIMEGLHLNLTHWVKLEQHMESLEYLEFVGGVTVDMESAYTFARICSKAGKVVFGDVSIEDIRGFVNNIVICINRKGGKCQLLQFGKEMLEKYKEELCEIRDKLGWRRYDESDGTDCFKIGKDDKFEERQREYTENSWNIMHDSDRICCLKFQFDRIENKLDKVNQRLEQSDQAQEEAEAEASSAQRQMWRMQDQMKRLEFERQRAQLERMTGTRWN